MLQKNFDILAISLNVLHNYFDNSIKLSDLYLAKFLDTLAKSVLPVKPLKNNINLGNFHLALVDSYFLQFFTIFNRNIRIHLFT